MHIDWNLWRMPLCPTSKGLRHITLKRSGAMIKFWYVHTYKPLMLSLKNLCAECHDNVEEIHNTKPTKCTNLFLRYLYYNITLNISTHFGL